MADQAPAQTAMAKNNKSDSSADGGDPRYEFAEHLWLGDMIYLKSGDGNSFRAGSKKLVLPSKVKLTYGEINALAGDFYAARKPISDGLNEKECLDLFIEAWGKLAASNSKIQTKDADTLRRLHQDEVDAFFRAVGKGENPSEAYAKLPDISWNLQWATISNRLKFFADTYLHISLNNLDHFGKDAETCYRIGHKAAIDFARNGGDLYIAYGMNAFADHFLEDLFSPGHMRTPRRDLHGLFMKDSLSKFMHDEECAIGLQVSNKRKNTWMAYGDKRLMDDENKQNWTYCLEALQASAKEVYNASQKIDTTPDKYSAWEIIPTRDSINANTQRLAPLFRVKDGKLQCRRDLKNRGGWAFEDLTDLQVTAFALKCTNSGLFKHPIKWDP